MPTLNVETLEEHRCKQCIWWDWASRSENRWANYESAMEQPDCWMERYTNPTV